MGTLSRDGRAISFGEEDGRGCRVAIVAARFASRAGVATVIGWARVDLPETDWSCLEFARIGLALLEPAGSMAGPSNTWLDLDGPAWTWLDMDGPGWTWLDLDGPGWPGWTWLGLAGPWLAWLDPGRP